MKVVRDARPSPALFVAAIALVFAMVGTAIAGPDASRAITKSKVKTIAKKQADKRLKANVAGSHVNEADTAANANAVGGTPLSGLLQTSGCQTGKVSGFARVKGEAAIPAAYTAATTFIDTTFNCSGGAVEVRKAGTGQYFVRFANNSAALATGQNNIDIEGSFSDDHDTIVNVGKITTGADAGAFRVETYDVAQDPSSVNAAPDDADFTLLLP